MGDATESYPGVAPPPEGIIPDVNNPQDGNHSLLLGWLVTATALTTIFFFARVYAKVVYLKRIVSEDITCAIAWFLFVIYSATTAVCLYYGQGHHAWEITPENYAEIRKWLYAGTIVYCPASYFTKVTLLLLIARVFAVREWVSKGIYWFIGGLLVAYLPIQIVKIFVCSPIRAYWDESVEGKCLNQTQLFYADISLAILTDFVILVIPIPLTWALRATGWMKLKVVVLLGAGGAATGVTSYRQWLAVQYMTSDDLTADFSVIVVTVLLELGIGLVCSCFPVLNKLSERWRNPRHSSSYVTPLSGWKLPFIRINHSSHSRGPDNNNAGGPQALPNGLELSVPDSDRSHGSSTKKEEIVSSGFVFRHGPGELNSVVGREEGWLVSNTGGEAGGNAAASSSSATAAAAARNEDLESGQGRDSTSYRPQ